MNSFKEEKCRGNVHPNSQKIVAVMSCHFWNCRGNVLRPKYAPEKRQYFKAK